MRDTTKGTRLCISLPARPTNTGTRFHSHHDEVLDLDYVYKAFTATDIVATIGGVRALGIRDRAVSIPWIRTLVDTHEVPRTACAVLGTGGGVTEVRPRGPWPRPPLDGAFGSDGAWHD